MALLTELNSLLIAWVESVDISKAVLFIGALRSTVRTPGAGTVIISLNWDFSMYQLASSAVSNRYPGT
jgi:hypothetical protein